MNVVSTHCQGYYNTFIRKKLPQIVAFLRKTVAPVKDYNSRITYFIFNAYKNH